MLELISNDKDTFDANVTIRTFHGTYGRDFFGLVIFWDETKKTFITRLEFGWMHMIFHPFKLGEGGIEAENLADLLTAMGVEREAADTAVRRAKTYLSVEWLPHPTVAMMSQGIYPLTQAFHITHDPKEGMPITPVNLGPRFLD